MHAGEIIAIVLMAYSDNVPSAVTRELPDNYPFVVQKRAILQFVDLWRAPALRLFESTQARVETLLLRMVSADAHFGHHSKLKQLVACVSNGQNVSWRLLTTKIGR